MRLARSGAWRSARPAVSLGASQLPVIGLSLQELRLRPPFSIKFPLSFFVYHHNAFDLLPSSFLLSFEYTFSCHLPSFIQFFISESFCQPHLRKRNTGLEALTREVSLVKAIV